MSSLTIRPVSCADEWLLWDWRNDPETRAQSFDSEPITPQQHHHWFWAKLCSNDTWAWLLEADGRPVAMARYERCGAYAEVSVMVALAERGRGYGTAVLEMTAKVACEAMGVLSVRALVFTDNAASVKAFQRAGYRVKGRQCYLMEWVNE